MARLQSFCFEDLLAENEVSYIKQHLTFQNSEGHSHSPEKHPFEEERHSLWDEHGSARGAPAMDTIYESHEEVSDSADEDSRVAVVLEEMVHCSCQKMAATPSLRSSPGDQSSHSCQPSLEESIHTWCETTGLPATVTAQLLGRTYNLHKFPLVSRSGYLKRMLCESSTVNLPDDCPGGLEAFELVINFCYSTRIVLWSRNVAAVLCASHFFELTEEYGEENLCKRSDHYLSEVVLHSWEDTLTVLRECTGRNFTAKELGIESRCIDSLASMACSNIHSKEKVAMPVNSEDWWIHDILQLQLEHFRLLLPAFRRNAMEEKFVTLALVKYAEKWTFSIINSATGDSTDYNCAIPCLELLAKYNLRCLVEDITILLPIRKYSVPTGFFISLLRCALAADVSSDCKNELEARIASQLEVATTEDLLSIRNFSNDNHMYSCGLSSTKKIACLFLKKHKISPADHLEASLQKNEENSDVQAVCVFAKLWDEYLAEIAKDSNLSSHEFLELADILPGYCRATHDQLYNAIDIYIQAHPHIAMEECVAVWKIVNYQKLSQKVCAHAVQNEIMPLRMIVQAMFMSQLQTHIVLDSNSPVKNPCAESPCETGRMNAVHKRSSSWQSPEPVCSKRSSFHRRGSSWHSREDFVSPENDIHESAEPLGLALQREAVACREAVFLQNDFNSTKSKLRSLEDELAHLKHCLHEKSEANLTRNEQPSKLISRLGGDTVETRKQSGGKSSQNTQQVKRLTFGQRLRKTLQKLGFKLFWQKSKQTACTEPTPKTRSYSERWVNIFKKQTYQANEVTQPLNVICRKSEAIAGQRKRSHFRHHSVS